MGPGGSLATPASGITGHVSRQVVISDHPHHVLVGEAMIVSQNGATHYSVTIGQAWDGVHRRLRMDHAWADGRSLPFRRVSRAERVCVGQNNCYGHRIGIIALSADMFSRAADSGLRARLTGPDAAIDIEIPAILFQEALLRRSGQL